MKRTLLEQLAAMKPQEDEPEAKPAPNTGQPKPDKPKPEPKPDGLKPDGRWENDSGQEEQLQEFDRVIRHTEKATLFGINDRCFWLPKSKYRTEDNQVIAPDWMQLTLKRIRAK